MKLPKYVYEMSTDELIKSVYRRIAVCGFDDSDPFEVDDYMIQTGHYYDDDEYKGQQVIVVTDSWDDTYLINDIKDENVKRNLLYDIIEVVTVSKFTKEDESYKEPDYNEDFELDKEKPSTDFIYNSLMNVLANKISNPVTLNSNKFNMDVKTPNSVKTITVVKIYIDPYNKNLEFIDINNDRYNFNDINSEDVKTTLMSDLFNLFVKRFK